MNVASELRKATAPSTGDCFHRRQAARRSLSFGRDHRQDPLRKERVADPLKRAAIESWLDHVLRQMFAGCILPITEDVILRWRLMVEAGRQRRHTYSQPVFHRRHRPARRLCRHRGGDSRSPEGITKKRSLPCIRCTNQAIDWIEQIGDNARTCHL